LSLLSVTKCIFQQLSVDDMIFAGKDLFSDYCLEFSAYWLSLYSLLNKLVSPLWSYCYEQCQGIVQREKEEKELSVCGGRIVGERETTADASYLLAQQAH
jgi:hypothetical protein